jgi:hypothetical protein
MVQQSARVIVFDSNVVDTAPWWKVSCKAKHCSQVARFPTVRTNTPSRVFVHFGRSWAIRIRPNRTLSYIRTLHDKASRLME